MRLAHGLPPGHAARVDKLCIFAGTTVFSYVGWYLGVLLGFEFFGCFLVSGVGCVFGVWAGWKVAQRFK